MLRILRFAIAAVVSCAILTGCGLASGDTTVAIRVVNAVVPTTTTPAATDFVISGNLFTTLNYDYITSYSFIGNGSNDIVGNATGTTTVVIPDVTYDFSASVTTIVAAGIPGAAATSAQPAFFFFTDDNTVPSSSQVRVRVINASANADGSPHPIDVSVGSTAVASALGYGSASTYTLMSAGTVNVVARNTTTHVELSTLLSQPLVGGGVYTFIFCGPDYNGNYTLIAQRDV